VSGLTLEGAKDLRTRARRVGPRRQGGHGPPATTRCSTPASPSEPERSNER